MNTGNCMHPIPYTHFILTSMPVLFPHPTAQKGILHLSPDVYQEMEASRNKGATAPSVTPMNPVTYMNPKEVSQAPFYNNSASKTAAMARELLNKTPKTPTIPCNAVQPSQQLEYLAHIQGFQVWRTSLS